MRTLDLFPHLIPKRKKARVMMHFIDVGVSPFKDGYQCAKFKCKKCGHETDFLHGYKTKSDVLRGEPCPNCNPAGEEISQGALCAMICICIFLTACAAPSPYGPWAKDYRFSVANTLIKENTKGR